MDLYAALPPSKDGTALAAAKPVPAFPQAWASSKQALLPSALRHKSANAVKPGNTLDSGGAPPAAKVRRLDPDSLTSPPPVSHADRRAAAANGEASHAAPVHGSSFSPDAEMSTEYATSPAGRGAASASPAASSSSSTAAAAAATVSSSAAMAMSGVTAFFDIDPADEYDPLRPNDYATEVERRRAAAAASAAAEDAARRRREQEEEEREAEEQQRATERPPQWGQPDDRHDRHDRQPQAAAAAAVTAPVLHERLRPHWMSATLPALSTSVAAAGPTASFAAVPPPPAAAAFEPAPAPAPAAAAAAAFPLQPARRGRAADLLPAWMTAQHQTGQAQQTAPAPATATAATEGAARVDRDVDVDANEAPVGLGFGLGFSSAGSSSGSGSGSGSAAAPVAARSFLPAAAPPPPQQQQQYSPPAPPSTTALSRTAAASGISAKAARMMERWGYTAGTGLGKDGSGILAPLIHQKTGRTSGIIRQANLLPAWKAAAAAAAAAAQSQAATSSSRGSGSGTSSGSRVVLVRNMLTAADTQGEAGEGLEEEVQEECSKYGAVEQVLVYVAETMIDGATGAAEPVPAAEAVRVFVEFRDAAAAARAVAGLGGRYFAGRELRASLFDEQRMAAFDLAPTPAELR